MAYAHAAPDERCSRCNDPASRLVGTLPLCVDHFTTLIDHCHHAVRRRILTPTDITPDGLTAWADLLRHGITIGVIDDDDARQAWESVREFAA
jgi:hypothetical protein